ncbi:MAG: hypothetical protein DRH17_12500, partial [Deltaproteobacteria bacterium]
MSMVENVLERVRKARAEAVARLGERFPKVKEVLGERKILQGNIIQGQVVEELRKRLENIRAKGVAAAVRERLAAIRGSRLAPAAETTAPQITPPPSPMLTQVKPEQFKKVKELPGKIY